MSITTVPETTTSMRAAPEARAAALDLLAAAGNFDRIAGATTTPAKVPESYTPKPEDGEDETYLWQGPAITTTYKGGEVEAESLFADDDGVRFYLRTRREDQTRAGDSSISDLSIEELRAFALAATRLIVAFDQEVSA